MSDNVKFAALSSEALESINACQSQLKTQDNKNVILVAYEKE